MSTRDLVQEALHSLEANKGRSLLTILGIVIGIASVIAMTSLIGGIQNSLVNSLGLNAARMVEIYSSQELTDSDVEKLRKLVPQIEQIGIVDSAYSEYKTGDKSYTVMAQGVDSDMLDAVGASKLVAGRTYSQAESQSGSRVALISRNGADQLYGNEQDALGKTIKVSNGEVQIVGVIDGGSDSMGSLTLYMPRETISGLFGDEVRGHLPSRGGRDGGSYFPTTSQCLSFLFSTSQPVSVTRTRSSTRTPNSPGR